MCPIVIQGADVRIPAGVSDFDAFRRWAKSDSFPERGWYSHLNGDLWVDPSMETLTHNMVKTAITATLTPLVRETGAGRMLGDRMLLTHPEAELSTEPDAMFIGLGSLTEGRVRLEEGADSLEVEGSPDMVLEVVSATSVEKDTVILRELYWRAGVREYWLVDPRGDQIMFDIFRYGPRGFVATRKQGGWLKSGVFGRSFRLTRQSDATGLADYALEVR